MKKLIATMVVAGLATMSFADEAGDIASAKKIQKKYRAAVVTVTAVAKMEMSGLGVMLGQGNEQKAEATGTIIDPSGLTVVSYSMLNPMGMIGAIRINMDGDSKEIKPENQLSDLKIVLSDGTEVEAKMVMQDPDLDLAFLMPKKKDGVDLPKFTSIDLKTNSKAEVLDKLVSLGRLGRILRRESSVSFSRISAVVKKPRTFYCLSGGMGGAPFFAIDGKVLGISAIRKAKDGGLSMSGISLVVVPAEDVQEVAKQALQEAKKKAN